MARRKGKKVIAYILLLILIGVGGYFWYQKTYTPILPPGSVTTTPVTEPTSTAPVTPGTPIVIKDTSTKEESAYYSINATYPSNGPAASDIASYVAATIASFKAENNPDNLNAVEKQEFAAGTTKYTLNMTYQIKNSDKVTSYVVETDGDTGGAHGFQDIKTFSYDGAGKLLLLDAFFTKGGYLPVLSDIVSKALAKQLGDNSSLDMIDAGTSPDAENFARFYTTNTSIVFEYPPYAVAPYAAGIVTVAIPIESFGAIINRAYFTN